MEENSTRKNALRPPLRLIYSLSRSGCTLISKCLGSMNNHYVLSEIHPKTTSIFNPVYQGFQWYHLFNQEEIDDLKDRRLSYIEAIQRLEQKSTKKGGSLIIRDWSHIDFIGVPFFKKATCQFTQSQILKNHFKLIEVAVVRHPIDVWLSLSTLSIMKESIRKGLFTINSFLTSYLAFAKEASKVEFIRYEDFTRDPSKVLQNVCRTLALMYDDNYKNRWYLNSKVTGDVVSTRGSNKIVTLKRRNIDRNTLYGFENSETYLEALRILNYS